MVRPAQSSANYALKRTVREEVSGENHALRSARPLSLGVRLGREIARWFAASIQSFAPSSGYRTSASLAAMLQSSASSCAASVSCALCAFAIVCLSQVGLRTDLLPHHRSKSVGACGHSRLVAQPNYALKRTVRG